MMGRRKRTLLPAETGPKKFQQNRPLETAGKTMRRFTPIRGLRSTLVAALSLALGAAPLHGQSHGAYSGGSHPYRQFTPQVRETPAPIERRPPPQQNNQSGQSASGQSTPGESRTPELHGPRGEHLAQWMSQHSNLSPGQQQRALEREPGFQQLPQQTQQRYRDRLAQLDAMPPQERQRLLAHTETMEHLSLDQRAQVRGAMQQLGSLPLDQRRAVARSFRELRNLPPEQRAAAANSPQYGWMNGPQRATLNNLLHVEPLLPAPER
jgi:hypothetical protein